MAIEYMSAQFHQPLYAHQSPRNIGEIDRVTVGPYSAIPAIDDTLNPCGEGDEIGILPPLFFDIKIDPSFWANYNCQAKVVIDAYSASSDLNNIFLSIFEGSDRYNITYKTASTLQPSNANAGTSVNPPTFHADGTKTYNYVITFRNDYLNTATDLSIARTTIHENLHAILLYLKTNGIVSTTENPTYQQLLNAYADKLVELGNPPFMPFNNNIHHGFMALFVDDIAQSLKAYGISKGYNLTDQFYNDMAWGGLTSIDSPQGPVINPAFQAIVPNSIDRNRILNRINAEERNEESEGEIPSLSQNSCNNP